MPQGLVSYANIASPKECVYTQTLGVHPDIAVIKCSPQAASISNSGTLQFSYNGSSLSMPGCVTKTISGPVFSSTSGFIVLVSVWDRRKRWWWADPISGWYNVVRAGQYVTGKKKNLRELATILFQAIGESSADVSVLSTSIYPSVRWKNDSPCAMLEQLLSQFGCSVALGFASENPTVVKIGTGGVLPTAGTMMATTSVDAVIRPTAIRVCFGKSIMQARFLLEPIALETDGSWVHIDDVSYKPAAGWEAEPPSLPTVAVTGSAEDYRLAVQTVYRAYRITKFADGTLDVPDGSGTLASIEQCLPLENRLGISEDIRSDGSSVPYRVYGKRVLTEKNPDGNPVGIQVETLIGDEVIGEDVEFHGETGVIIFKDPQYKVDAGNYKPADLYLECSFGIVSASDNSPGSYAKDVTVDASGVGIHSVKFESAKALAIVEYDSSHAVTSVTTNQTAIDTLAADIAALAAVQFSTNGSAVAFYHEPKLSLRCDGLITQIKHVVSDGHSEPGAYTTASWNTEFDVEILRRQTRMNGVYSAIASMERRERIAMMRDKEESDD